MILTEIRADFFVGVSTMILRASFFVSLQDVHTFLDRLHPHCSFKKKKKTVMNFVLFFHMKFFDKNFEGLGMVRSLITVSFIHRGSLLGNHDGANVNTVTCTDSSWRVYFFTGAMETTARTQDGTFLMFTCHQRLEPCRKGTTRGSYFSIQNRVLPHFVS